MPPAGSFLDALPIIVMGVVLVAWVLFFRLRKGRDAKLLQPISREEFVNRTAIRDTMSLSSSTAS
jgi:hypothetical protein